MVSLRRTHARRVVAIGRALGTSGKGFTLIEVLVVVAVLALLISILLPSLSRARSQAKKAVCKTLLRGYQFASEMYSIENKGVLMDSYKHLDPRAGVPRYWGSSRQMPKNAARCPDDGSTEAMGRLGRFAQYGGVLVSIGANENTMSASARMTRFGPMAFWVKRDELKRAAWKMMTWADWQNNPLKDEPAEAIVKPVEDTATGVDEMGSLAFRHDGVSCAAYLDGHVGEMRPTVVVINDGHDLAPGNDWGITGSIGQLTKTYYPFGPAKGFDKACKGDWPTIRFR